MDKPQLPFCLRAIDLVQRAPSDPNSAAEALLEAAGYIRRGEPLPNVLANYLAGGIETAMQKPVQHDPYNADRGRALLVALHLESNNRRPVKADGYTVWNFMSWLISGNLDDEGKPIKGVSQNEAAKQAAEKFGISESTAKRLFRQGEENDREYEADVLADIAANPDDYR